jgi:glycosyltransferase involved in cell wall biosynthesis
LIKISSYLTVDINNKKSLMNLTSKVSMKIGVAHSRFFAYGGAERAILNIAEWFDAPVITAAVDCELPSSHNIIEFLPAWKQINLKLPVLRTIFNQIYFENPKILYDYDVVITSSNNWLAFVPKENQMWIHYVHATDRSATDLFYLNQNKTLLESILNKLKRIILSNQSKKPDVMVCNSEIVQRRVSKYWGRSNNVFTIPPPLNLNKYSADLVKTGSFYLSLSRLVSSKEILEVITEFKSTDLQLKIAGTGPLKNRVLKSAKGVQNIEYLGKISEGQKRRVLSEARALIINARAEDFGITAVEALASGTPLIVVNEGYPATLVQNGISGVKFERGKLLDAIQEFENSFEVNESRIMQLSENYSIENIMPRFDTLIEKAVSCDDKYIDHLKNQNINCSN